MPVQKRTLNVLPNPWLYIDHNGLPVGRAAMEANVNGVPESRHVGARIAETVLTSAAKAGVPLAQDVHDIIEMEYAAEPVVVRNSDYYRRRIMDGDLIAADRDSFVAAGGRPKDFEDYKAHIEAKKKAAIAQFDLENGEGAFKLLEQQRAEDAKARDAVAASVKAEREGKEAEAIAKTTKPAASAPETKGDKS